MHSYPQEFVLLCRQLGEAQQRCSAVLASQAARIEALQAEVVRLRGAVVLSDTRLALAQEALASARAAEPDVPRRKAMARHIVALAERIGTLSRECLRWRLAAEADAMDVRPFNGLAARARGAADGPHAAGANDLARAAFDARSLASDATVIGAGVLQEESGAPCAPVVAVRGTPDLLLDTQAPARARFDASLAAADLVICQTGCISHDEYWRVQDHCRRTGKPCILVDQPLAMRGAQLHHPQPPSQPQSHTAPATEPAVILRMTRPRRPDGALAAAEVGGQTPRLNKRV